MLRFIRSPCCLEGMYAISSSQSFLFDSVSHCEARQTPKVLRNMITMMISKDIYIYI
jgi:hypothetical protein